MAELAIDHAAAARWAEAADTNRKILELGSDAEAENRLAKSLWNWASLAKRESTTRSRLALDPTNRIAERKHRAPARPHERGGDKSAAPEKAEKAPVAIFVEETGKTGFAMLTDLASPRALAHVNPGDSVELIPEGNRLFAEANGTRIGIVEAARSGTPAQAPRRWQQVLGGHYFARRPRRPAS